MIQYKKGRILAIRPRGFVSTINYVLSAIPFSAQACSGQNTKNEIASEYSNDIRLIATVIPITSGVPILPKVCTIPNINQINPSPIVKRIVLLQAVAILFNSVVL